MVTRRQFMLTVAPMVGVGLLGSKLANAQTGKVLETEPTAVALGYKEDAKKVDAKKFTTYKAGDTCATCQLFTGKATDATGPCAAFSNRPVATKGWCSAYVKKA